jgi:hypothetical protein
MPAAEDTETVKPTYSAFFVPTENLANEEAGRLAVGWLVDRSRVDGGEPLIVVPSWKNATSNRIVAAATARFRTETWRTVGNHWWDGGPVLLMWADDKIVRRFAADHRVVALCVVPGLFHPIDAWIRATGAIDLADREAVPVAPTIADPITAEAMRELASFVNTDYLVNVEDVAYAVRTLQVLHDAGHRLDAVELEAWALASGWDPDAARLLVEYIKGVLSGHRYRLRETVGPTRDALRHWREAVEAPKQ